MSGYRRHDVRKISAMHTCSGSVVLNHDIAIMSLSALVDASKTSLFLSLGSITFNPTAWNIVARNGMTNSVSPSFASMTDPVPHRHTQKNTATRQSLAFLVAMVIWVVTSSPCAFLVRGYCVTTCTSPAFFSVLSPSFPLSIHPFFLTIGDSPIHIPTQLPKRNPRTAACTPPPHSTRYARSRRTLRHRTNLRRDLDMVARYHRHIPRRLLRYPYGCPRRGLPIQHAS